MKLILLIASIPFIVWVIVAGVWGWFTYDDWKMNQYEPLVAGLESKKTELSSLKASNDKAEAFKREREDRFRKIQELELQLKDTTDRLPRSPNIADLLKELANISDRTGLEFYSFKPGPETADNFLRVTPVEVEMKGSYTQVMNFMDESANTKRIIAPVKLGLEKPTPRGATRVVTANATLYAYRLESDKEAAERIAKMVKEENKGDKK